MVLGGGWHGHNFLLGIERLGGTDMIMVMQYSFFRVDGRVVALYCAATWDLFEKTEQEMMKGK